MKKETIARYDLEAHQDFPGKNETGSIIKISTISSVSSCLPDKRFWSWGAVTGISLRSLNPGVGWASISVPKPSRKPDSATHTLNFRSWTRRSFACRKRSITSSFPIWSANWPMSGRSSTGFRQSQPPQSHSPDLFQLPLGSLPQAAEKLDLKMRQPYQNWLSPSDLANFLNLTGFEVIRKGGNFWSLSGFLSFPQY